MLARNATIITFSNITPDGLQAAVERRQFVPCGAIESSSAGFVPPAQGNVAMSRRVGNVIAIALREDSKILPACVVQAEVKRRAEELEEQQGFRPGRKQTKELKEVVTDDLLAKAFIRTTIVRAWLDFDAGLLVIDASSDSKADHVLGALVRSLEEAPMFRRWRTVGAPVDHFTNWVHSSEAPEDFSIDDRALFTGDDGSKVRLTNRSIVDDAAVTKLMESGQRCSELALTYADKLSFVLTSGLVLRRIEHIGMNQSENPNQPDMLEEERLDAEIVLNASAIREAFNAISGAMQGVAQNEESAGVSISITGSDDDPLYEKAAEVVTKTGKASISLVQRHLRIGYNRAARLLEKMEAQGVVSPMNSSGVRRVIDAQAAA